MRCIFIGGCDRSGTTFLASLLGGVLDAIVTPESIFKDYLLNAKNELKMHHFSKMKNDWRFKVWDVELTKQHTTLRVSELLLSLVQDFAKAHDRQGSAYWIDHSPNNFNNFNMLSSLFPDCFFIHIVRDGRSVCSSLMKREWGPNTPLYSAFYWKNKLVTPLAYSFQFPERVITVRYEDLLIDPSSEIARIISLIKGDKIVELGEIKPVDYFLPRFTRKQHSLIGQNAVERKLYDKNILSEKDCMIFDYYCSDILIALGYKVDKIAKPKLGEIIYLIFKEIVLNRINLIKYKRLRVNQGESMNDI